MKHTEETRAHAREVLDFITFNPHVHEQDNWFNIDGETHASGKDAVVSEDENICNTTMCIAGTSAWLRKGVKGLDEFTDDDITAVAESGAALGLDFDEADALFMNFNNEKTVDMLRAVAEGDTDKFWAIRKQQIRDDDY